LSEWGFWGSRLQSEKWILPAASREAEALTAGTVLPSNW
jgi:hypothetical protein